MDGWRDANWDWKNNKLYLHKKKELFSFYIVYLRRNNFRNVAKAIGVDKTTAGKRTGSMISFKKNANPTKKKKKKKIS